MTAPTGPDDNDFVQVDVSNDITTAVVLESQIRSQGIQVVRMDHGFEGPPPPTDGCMHRLLVRRRDLPLVLEMLEELQGWAAE